MKLFKLLEFHKQYTALPQNFGDGFLYQNNAFYAAIRDYTLKLGYTYSEEDNLHAIVLPFAQLEQIFKLKKIPLINNVSVFESLSAPARQEVEWVEVEMGYKRNYLFHESCHVVARDILQKTQMPDRILNLLLEESFANVCELFAMALVKGEAHQIFYEANSYTRAFEDSDRLQQIFKQFGHMKCFQFTLLAYLHSNLLYPTYTDKDFKVVSQFVFKRELTQPQAQQIGFLAEMAFSLDEGFKYATRGLHFKLNNYSETEFNQLKKGYLSPLLAAPQTTNMLDTMAKVFYT